MSSRSLRLAGHCFSFSFTRDSLSLGPAYDGFACEENTASISGTYQICNSLNPAPGNATPLWSGPTWRMLEMENDVRIDLRVLDRDEWMPTAQITRDFSSGQLIPLVGRHPQLSTLALNYPLDQILFINRLPRCGAVLLHASGIQHNGKIYLFCGRSDIGKTTMARMWRDARATLLNDDRMLVWMDKGTILASPSPWHGEDPEINVHTAPVAGIYHLHQSREHTLESLAPAQALSALTATAVLPFYLEDSLGPGLDVLQSAAESVPSCRLGFHPSPDVVDFVLRHEDSQR